MPPTTAPRRAAIGIVCVSQTNGREGESFVSPGEQEDRIRTECEHVGLHLIEPVIQEMDVSGGTPLDQRRGLRQAVEAVEAGEADVIVAAYFDRLVRSLRVQGELVERVEQAGGQVLAVDVGQITNGSAGQWLSGTMLGAVSEYQRRTAKERSAGAQADAVARGVLPYPNVPPGYVKGSDGRLEPDPEKAPVVLEALRLRADGATVAVVRAFLAANGIARSYHGAYSLLASRVVLGEVHFGDLQNLNAHEPIVDLDTWRRAQRASVPRGRQAKSDRLLARLGVLRCASCNARMVVGRANHGAYPLYRCPPNGGCARRVTISAEMVESIVVEAVRSKIADAEGRASAERNVRQAVQAVESAQADLDAGFRAFAGYEDEAAARDRLGELRQARDTAQEQLDQLGGVGAAVTVTADADWDRLSLEEQRDLIRATVERVTVVPGRGAGRVTVEMLGQ